MAEVKNAFIKSKMNKDLDDRLLPPGEYRDGQNIQVSKSEGEDVGALENAVGNSPAVNSTDENVDFSVLAGLTSGTLKSIGVYADTNSSTIYVFLTDYTEQSINNITYSPTANNYIYSYNTLTLKTSKLVEGSFLNFSTTNPIYGINVLENLLFWTDNRNQPRKINLDLANDGLYYTSEDLISVAKYNPYQTINLYYNAPELNGAPASSYQDVTSEFLPDGTTANPFYNPNWPGDKDYLEDKFVTFSYRFKFTDGEYSIMAPFTQEAFIPKQDGYFLGNTDETSDELTTYRNTIVSFMENKVNNVKLFIPLPYQANLLNSKLGVEAIDILYKESDSLAVKVLDTVPNSIFSFTDDEQTPNNSLQYNYDYQSRKPYKTLPESEIIRVYDKVPVRAFGQEVISNRIVYSNFQDKHTPPETINYDVAVTAKDEFNLNGNKATHTTSAVEYPMHTVKQHRNYQVGFVLSDRYGRQSTTILSPVSAETKQDENITFGGSTFFHPYTANPGAGNNNVNSWAGDSLKVLVNQGIPSDTPNLSTGWPGLYNGDINSQDYNPLGWYSYKIVVKQTEQEYYNVYLPGILNGYPDYGSGSSNIPDPQNTIAFITLIGDNINKVPRNLTEVGPEQRQYGSSVQLHGRVTPNATNAPTFTKPYYPGAEAMTVVTIAEQDFMFADNATGPFASVYQTDSNPYLARISQGNTTISGAIGSLQASNVSSAYNLLLGVFETEPTVSLLDIFWETSSTGLISDFNASAGLTGNSDGWYNFEFNQTEATEQGQNATTGAFSPKIEDGLNGTPMLSSQVTLVSVFDGTPTPSQNITANWSLLKITTAGQADSYNLVVQNPMYFSPDALKNTFTFNFRVKDLTTGNIFNMPITNNRLTNVDPTINSIEDQVFQGDRDLNQGLFTLSGVNGCVQPNSTNTPTNAGLTYQKISQFPENPPLQFLSNAVVYEPTGDASGKYTATFQVTDSGGGTDQTSVNLLFGEEQINEDFGTAKNVAFLEGLESGGIYWASNYQTCISEGPIPNAVNNTNSGRVAYNTENLNLSLDPNALTTQSFQTKQVENLYDRSGDSFESQQYVWKNTNVRPEYFTGQSLKSDVSLTSGTAYVKVDFSFKSWPNLDVSPAPSYAGDEITMNPIIGEQYGIGWVAYLQYKPQGQNSQWQTAVDIEGKDIRFGGTQANGKNNNNFSLSGALTNSTEATGYQPPVASHPFPSGQDTSVSVNDIAQATVAYPSDRRPNTSVFSKVFAFGKDQKYEQTPDKFGEYRLLIKFPQSLAGGTRDTANTNVIVPWKTQTDLDYQFFAAAGSEFVQKNIRVNLSFGDFYYANSDNSFSYFVSTSGKPDSSSAAIDTPFKEVFAREWSHKYITELYEDAALTIPWIPNLTNGNWFSYSGTADNDGQGEVPFNVANGSENSFINGINSGFTSIGSSTLISNRRWVAQFDENGKKLKGTAIPSTGNVGNL
jgi:hypothetical protein